MGCCHTEHLELKNEALFYIKVKEAIDLSDFRRLVMIYSLYQKIHPEDKDYMDRKITKIAGRNLNALGYCVYSGNSKMFVCLLEIGASLILMNDHLENQGLRAINMICAKNQVQFLQAYLPIYLANPYKTKENIHYNFEIPLHTAIRTGSIGIISFLYLFFEGKEIPEEFSVTALNDKGETAAHIVCRFGHFSLVKLLHTKMSADFFQLNLKKENCLVSAANGYKKNPNLNFLDVFKYLIEVVGLDICYMHEDILICVESDEILFYLERKLKEKGIFTTREEVVKCSFTLKGFSLANSKNCEGMLELSNKESLMNVNNEGFTFSIEEKNWKEFEL